MATRNFRHSIEEDSSMPLSLRQRQGALVADLVLTAAQAVHTEVEALLVYDPDLYRNGGTILSVEEQKAFQTIHRRLVSP